MRIDLLCSGSKGNCCLVRSQSAQILIDCGCTKKYLLSSLAQVGARLEDTDALLVSHSHSDHIKGLKFCSSVPIYSYCDLSGCAKEDLQPFDRLQIKDLSILIIPLSHDAGNTIGFVIESATEKLVYVTDTGYIANSNKPYLKGATYYIFESNHDVEMLMSTSRPPYLKQRILSPLGHLNNEESASNLADLVDANTKEIVLAHLSQEANTHELALQTLYSTFSRKKPSVVGIEVRAAEQFKILTIGTNSK